MELHNLIPLSISGEPEVGGSYNYVVCIPRPHKISAITLSYEKRACSTNNNIYMRIMRFVSYKKGEKCRFFHLKIKCAFSRLK